MLDIENTKKAFQKYIQQFDVADDKINLKLIHTYHVVETSKYICLHEGIEGEDYQLAMIIALLHDIGRFEQLKRYHSFNDENIDHAKLGVNILFNEKMIEYFVEDRKYDEIIKTAILYHSLYKIPSINNKQILLHCLLIRDSDKLDNFRVKNHASIKTLFDISENEFLSLKVSDNIIENIKNHQLILKADRHNEVDMWVSYFAFVFDLHFSSSYQYLQETNYIARNMSRFHFTGKLKEQMDFVRDECIKYIEEKAEK